MMGKLELVDTWLDDLRGTRGYRKGVPSLGNVLSVVTDIDKCLWHMKEGHGEHWRKGMIQRCDLLAKEAKALGIRVRYMKAEIKRERRKMREDGRI